MMIGEVSDISELPDDPASSALGSPETDEKPALDEKPPPGASPPVDSLTLEQEKPPHDEDPPLAAAEKPSPPSQQKKDLSSVLAEEESPDAVEGPPTNKKLKGVVEEVAANNNSSKPITFEDLCRDPNLLATLRRPSNEAVPPKAVVASTNTVKEIEPAAQEPEKNVVQTNNNNGDIDAIESSRRSAVRWRQATRATRQRWRGASDRVLVEVKVCGALEGPKHYGTGPSPKKAPQKRVVKNRALPVISI